MANFSCLLEHVEGYNAPYEVQLGGFEVRSDIALTVTVCIVSELQRDTLHHSHAIAFSWN